MGSIKLGSQRSNTRKKAICGLFFFFCNMYGIIDFFIAFKIINFFLKIKTGKIKPYPCICIKRISQVLEIWMNRDMIRVCLLLWCIIILNRTLTWIWCTVSHSTTQISLLKPGVWPKFFFKIIFLIFLNYF